MENNNNDDYFIRRNNYLSKIVEEQEKIQEEKKIYDKIKEENINKIILTNIILSGIIYEYMK